MKALLANPAVRKLLVVVVVAALTAAASAAGLPADVVNELCTEVK